MASNRWEVLTELVTELTAVTGVTTVVRAYTDVDITQYLAADLPLIEVREPAEGNEAEMTGMRAMAYLEMKLKVWFVNWGENPTSTYDTLVKNIRDKIGGSFTLNCEATKCLVVGVSVIQGIMPVYFFEVELSLQYYLNQQAV